MKNYDEPNKKDRNEWENDPNNWIWGMFYYNPKDKRLYFPKKTRELGWHTNYAHPDSVIILLLLLSVILIFVILYLKR
jgi:uncharacterized membrane protein